MVIPLGSRTNMTLRGLEDNEEVHVEVRGVKDGVVEDPEVEEEMCMIDLAPVADPGNPGHQ